MEALEKGSIYTAVIDGYSSEGLGIARVNGAVVFVPHAVRGEEIDLRITKVMKTSCAGEIVKIHDPSPERMEPECPYAGKCGGCAYRHLTYPEELWAKRQRVQDALTRIGGLELTVEEILGAKNPEHYRNKSQYPVGADGSIGFFQARTHKVVPIRRCLIQTEAADRTAQAVGEWMRRYKISAYDETTGKGLVRHVCVRVNRKGESLCCVVVNGNKVPREPELAAYVTAAVPHTVGVLLNSNTRRGNVVLGDKYRTLFGRNYLMDTLCGLEFKLSMPSFYQVNRDQAEVLYGKALEFAGLTGNETVLDLYCGIGTITLCLAKAAKRVIGAEIVPPAIRDAKENALRNHIENAEFFCGDAADIAAKLESDGLRPDVVTVDPPRKGLAPEVIASVAAMGPEKVVYVSCDPATLGRDVKIFREFGYEAKRAAAVDMFPGTAHVETVVLLSRETNPLTVEVRMEVETGEVKEHPTYKRIQEYVQEKYGFKVHTAYIAEVKRMVGLDMHKAREEKEGKHRLWERCVNRLRFSAVSIAAAREKREGGFSLRRLAAALLLSLFSLNIRDYSASLFGVTGRKSSCTPSLRSKHMVFASATQNPRTL